jgi:excisionase family DNA binding protein
MKLVKQHQRLTKVASGRQRSDDSECEIWTIEQAGRRLGISRGHAYALAKNGGLPTIRLGKRWLVPKRAIEKLLGT